MHGRFSDSPTFYLLEHAGLCSERTLAMHVILLDNRNMIRNGCTVDRMASSMRCQHTHTHTHTPSLGLQGSKQRKLVREGFLRIQGIFGGYVWKSFPYTNPRKNQERPRKNQEKPRKTNKKKRIVHYFCSFLCFDPRDTAAHSIDSLILCPTPGAQRPAGRGRPELIQRLRPGPCAGSRDAWIWRSLGTPSVDRVARMKNHRKT